MRFDSQFDDFFVKDHILDNFAVVIRKVTAAFLMGPQKSRLKLNN